MVTCTQACVITRRPHGCLCTRATCAAHSRPSCCGALRADAPVESGQSLRRNGCRGCGEAERRSLLPTAQLTINRGSGRSPRRPHATKVVPTAIEPRSVPQHRHRRGHQRLYVAVVLRLRVRQCFSVACCVAIWRKCVPREGSKKRGEAILAHPRHRWSDKKTALTSRYDQSLAAPQDRVSLHGHDTPKARPE